jgi:hypothetical protein
VKSDKESDMSDPLREKAFAFALRTADPRRSIYYRRAMGSLLHDCEELQKMLKSSLKTVGRILLFTYRFSLVTYSE